MIEENIRKQEMNNILNGIFKDVKKGIKSSKKELIVI